MWAFLFFLPLVFSQLTVNVYQASPPALIVDDNTQIYNVHGDNWNCDTTTPVLNSFESYTDGQFHTSIFLECLKFYPASSCAENIQQLREPMTINVLKNSEYIVDWPTRKPNSMEVPLGVVYNFYLRPCQRVFIIQQACIEANSSMNFFPTTAEAVIPIPFNFKKDSTCVSSLSTTTGTMFVQSFGNKGTMTTTFKGQTYSGKTMMLSGTGADLQNLKITFIQIIPGTEQQSILFNITGIETIDSTLTFPLSGKYLPCDIMGLSKSVTMTGASYAMDTLPFNFSSCQSIKYIDAKMVITMQKLNGVYMGVLIPSSNTTITLEGVLSEITSEVYNFTQITQGTGFQIIDYSVSVQQSALITTSGVYNLTLANVVNASICGVGAVYNSIVNITSVKFQLPTFFTVDSCAVGSGRLTIDVVPYNTQGNVSGIIITQWQGVDYQTSSLKVNGTVTDLKNIVVKFAQTGPGNQLQVIKYTWLPFGGVEIPNGQLMTSDYSFYLPGWATVVSDTTVNTTTASILSPVITTAGDSGRESAIYTIVMFFIPAKYSEALVKTYIAYIFRVSRGFINLRNFRFLHNKFAPMQESQKGLAEFNFEGLSASQEAKALEYARTICTTLLSMNSVNVDCDSIQQSSDKGSSSSDGLRAGAIVGIIIGTVVLALCLIAIAAWVVMKHQSSPQPHYPDKEEDQPPIVNYAVPAPIGVPAIGYDPSYTATYSQPMYP